MKITTKHTEIGYTCNLEIIERALRDRFGVNDNSHVATAVAAHVWSEVCGRGAVDGGISWGSDEISRAIKAIKFRVSKIEDQIEAVTNL